VSGVNPAQFGNVVIASGTLPSGSYQDAQVRGAYNMTAPAEYRFVPTTNVTGNGDPLNNAMTTQVIRYQGGTAAAEPTTVCSGLPVELTVSYQRLSIGQGALHALTRVVLDADDVAVTPGRLLAVGLVHACSSA